MMTEITGTGGEAQIDQAQIQDYKEAHPDTDFSNMSVEDIMFLVMSDRAKAQKENIEIYAAGVEANTLKATNINNLKAAIDNAASSSDGAAIDTISVSWENSDGTTEAISMGEACTRLDVDLTASPTAETAVEDQQKYDSDLAKVDADQTQAQTDIDAWQDGDETGSKGEAETMIGDDVGYAQDGKTAEETSTELYEDPHDSGVIGAGGTADYNAIDQAVTDVTADNAKVGADLEQYETDEHALVDDSWTTGYDAESNISQADLKTLSANLADAHDKIDGDNQIAMAKLQKDMDDYQTTLQTIESSVSSMARTAQGFASKLGGG